MIKYSFHTVITHCASYIVYVTDTHLYPMVPFQITEHKFFSRSSIIYLLNSSLKDLKPELTLIFCHLFQYEWNKADSLHITIYVCEILTKKILKFHIFCSRIKNEQQFLFEIKRKILFLVSFYIICFHRRWLKCYWTKPNYIKC